MKIRYLNSTYCSITNIQVVVTILITLFLVINCKDAPVTYVDTLVGLNLRDRPSIKAEVITVLPHKTKVTIIDKKTEKFVIQQKSGSWVLVKALKLKGWLFSGFLNEHPKQYYYKVIALKGLNLREQPQQEAKIIKTLKHYHYGEIIKTNRMKIRIDSKRGYWFQTKEDNLTGWLFSGYTITSTDFSVVSSHTPIELLYNSIDIEKETLETLLSDTRIEKKLQVGNFTVYQVRLLNAYEGCGKRRKVLYQNNITKKTHSNNYYSEEIIKRVPTIGNAIVASFVGCCDCCPWQGERLVMIGQKIIRSLDISQTNQTSMSCTYNLINGLVYGLFEEKRITSDGQLLIYRKQPKCPQPSVHNSNLNDVGYSHLNKKNIQEIAHKLFAVLKFNNQEPEFKKFIDQDVPAKFQNIWNAATPF